MLSARLFLAFLSSVLLAAVPRAQTPESILLRNPSFGAYNRNFTVPPGWTPHVLFLAGEDPRFLRITRFYRNSEPSHHGNTHIALATYRNGLRENIGQRLRYPMIRGHRYSLDIWCAYSPDRTTVHPIQRDPAPRHDLQPVRLQLVGFSEDGSRSTLLAETPVIDHADWRKYTLAWTCAQAFRYLYLVAHWAGPDAIDGNVLLDDISPIRVQLMTSKDP